METAELRDKLANLLARTGKLEAHKEKRNWVTTLSAIERYMKGRERQRNVPLLTAWTGPIPNPSTRVYARSG